MPVLPIRNHTPILGARVFVAPDAWLTGDLEAGDDCSFWFGVVARGDVNWIRIGPETNVQDGTILHVSHDTHPLSLGAGVIVGHQAVLHGCTVADGALIGIGARVLDGAVIESGAQVAAGAVVAPGHRIPAGQLAVGIPARPRRALSDEEIANIGRIRDRYVTLKDEYLRALE